MMRMNDAYDDDDNGSNINVNDGDDDDFSCDDGLWWWCYPYSHTVLHGKLSNLPTCLFVFCSSVFQLTFPLLSLLPSTLHKDPCLSSKLDDKYTRDITQLSTVIFWNMGEGGFGETHSQYDELVFVLHWMVFLYLAKVCHDSYQLGDTYKVNIPFTFKLQVTHWNLLFRCRQSKIQKVLTDYHWLTEVKVLFCILLFELLCPQ